MVRSWSALSLPHSSNTSTGPVGSGTHDNPARGLRAVPARHRAAVCNPQSSQPAIAPAVRLSGCGPVCLVVRAAIARRVPDLAHRHKCEFPLWYLKRYRYATACNLPGSAVGTNGTLACSNMCASICARNGRRASTLHGRSRSACVPSLARWHLSVSRPSAAERPRA